MSIAALPLSPARADATRQLQLLLAGLGVAWLACELAAACGYSYSLAYLALINLIALPHFPIALGSAYAFFLCTNPPQRDLLLSLPLAVFGAAGFKLLEFAGGWHIPVMHCGCVGLGVAGLATLASRTWISEEEDRKKRLAALLTALLVVGSVPFVFFFLALTIQLCPTTQDAFAYAADETLGAQWAFVLGRAFQAVPVLASIAHLAYILLPLTFIVLLVMHLRAGGPPTAELLPAVLLVAASGFVMYLLCPLVGPTFYFRDVYPFAAPSVEAILANPPAAPDDARNCMPSLHTAWSLLIWWHSRGLARWVRVLAAVGFVLTVLATVGFGAHYVFDVVVAFPSTMACHAACLRLPLSARASQIKAVGIGVGLTAFWLVLLRHGLPLLRVSPWLTVPAALVTVLLPLVVEYRLHRQADRT